MSPTYRRGFSTVSPSGRDIVKPSFQKVGLAGFDLVIRRLNEAIKKIEGACVAGMVRAALKIRYDTEETSPITPLDLGNLRASFFIVTSEGKTPYSYPRFKKGPGISGRTINAEQLAELSSGHARAKGIWKSVIAGKKPIVALGYSAYYSGIVHEMLGSINWSRPGSGPKWFQAAFRRNRGAILQLIRSEVQIPP